MSRLRSLGLLTIIAVLFAMTGCAVNQSESEYPAVEAGSRLDLEYPIDGRTKMLSLTIQRSGNLPTVIVSGEGARARTGIVWKAQWYDSSGRQITGTSNRSRRATINPGVAFTLQATAPVPDARTVQVQIRQSDNK